MAALSFTPAALSGLIRLAGLAHDPIRVRHVAARPEAIARTLSVGGGFEGTAALAKVGGAAWLTVPETCEDGVPFDVTISAAALKAGNFAETIRATKAAFEPGDCVVSLAVQPQGPKP